MSRDLETGMIQEINAPRLQPVLLCDFEFDGGTVRLWNGLGELTANGETYTGAGHLLSVSDYQEKQRLEAIGMTFTLSGISSSIMSIALGDDYQGRPCTLYFGVIPMLENSNINTEADAILQAEDGSSITTETTGGIVTYTQFSGFMDVMQISEGGDTCSISVSAESKAIILSRVKERRYTDADQRSQYPDDKGLEFVTLMQDKEVIWRAAK